MSRWRHAGASWRTSRGDRSLSPHRRRAAAFASAFLPALAITCLMAMASLFAATPSAALDANGQLEDPALQARFEHIVKDLRCLVCQNESIADSNVELASDLRRQVREMLIAGKSDDANF